MSYERDNIRRMQGYTWGEQPEDGRTIKLNTNENPYPPSPAVAAALASVDVSRLRTYPDPLARVLRGRLAAHHRVQPEQIVLTHGGDEALRLALTTFVGPGQGFGTAEPSYSLYPVLGAIQDARPVTVDLDTHWLPPADFAGQLNQAEVRLACLVNPHAPSGALLDARRLYAIASELKGVLLIDEAYVDFVDPAQGYSALPLVRELPNVLILRSFSKGYGLAGLRLGYLIGSPGLIETIVTKTRDSYNVDYLSQQLGLAAFDDQGYAAENWARVRAERQRLGAALTGLGLRCHPSESNFLLATIGAQPPREARALYEALKQQGILVRYFNAPRLHDKLRISIGTREQNDQLLEAIRAWL